MQLRTTIWLAAVLALAVVSADFKIPVTGEESNLNSNNENSDDSNKYIGDDPLHNNTTTPEATTDTPEPDTTTSDTTEYPTGDPSEDPTEDPTENPKQSTPGEGTAATGDDDITENPNIVNTGSGRVQGFQWEGNSSIIGFYDIPYGTYIKPLQAATHVNNWTDIHGVQEHSKRCSQLEGDGYIVKEDCLTLSIFRHVDSANATVLFHIHGDNFTTGSGDPHKYVPDHLVANGIILVLPNYRLGALGFLCMQNETAPGNIALKDLSLALSWIHRNIRAFGGDPNNIVVSGDGNSGALAGYLALSPMSKKYVSKVITESGSFLSYLSLDRNPNITALHLINAIKAGSSAESRDNIAFDDLDENTIVRASKGIEFKPCLEDKQKEDAFMIKAPFEILSPEEDDEPENVREDIEITFLIGSAMYAGAHEALGYTAGSISQLNNNHSRLLPNDLIFNATKLKQNAADAIKLLYFGNDTIRLNNTESLSRYHTDIGYLGPCIRSARLLVAAGATVYFYEFSFVGKYNRELAAIGRRVPGAVRGDIIGYLFNQDNKLRDDSQIDNESRIIDMLTEMWTNFMKTGSPTGTVQWAELTETDHDKEAWLLIDNLTQMQRSLHADRMSLWTEIYKYHFIDNRSHRLSPSLFIIGFQFAFWFYKGVNKMF